MELGKKQTLKIVQQVDFGVYLAEESDTEAKNRVLLPAKQVPSWAKPGDLLPVFLYRDSKDRLIATTNEPKLMLGEVGVLTVSATGKIGAFLDWGLEKDLFLPFKEQTSHVNVGDEVLVAVYTDKSDRLCATMNVYKYLENDSEYKTGDQVRGTLYLISHDFGGYVAVDNRYSALIPKREMYGDFKAGQVIEARVTRVKEDGRLNLSVREKAYLQIGMDAEKILKLIDSYDGALPFNDKASPETINRECGMSKNEFKRAVGNLLKKGVIKITEKGILRI